ncbi:hypothetical protein ACFLZX_06455 [Nanoarchaeota archaeon]
MQEFTGNLNRLNGNIDLVLSKVPNMNIKDVFSYKSAKESYYLSLFESSLQAFLKSAAEIQKLETKSPVKMLNFNQLIITLETQFKNKDLEGMKKSTEKIEKLFNELELPKNEDLKFSLKNVPADISHDVSSDLRELEKCFNSNCNRSSIILCGRILETALHRKYFEVTGTDILEKNPGIGLGTLVAKLSDKDVILDPAVLQQIHLINQVRIFSVHKKKESFNPSKQQTQATILYTLDIVQKLFS